MSMSVWKQLSHSAHQNPADMQKATNEPDLEVAVWCGSSRFACEPRRINGIMTFRWNTDAEVRIMCVVESVVALMLCTSTL